MITYAFLDQLDDTIARHMIPGRPVLIAVGGKTGVGKSTLGRYLRKRGTPAMKPSELSVIDRDRLSLPFLFFFRRQVRFPSSVQDELAPFQPYIRSKKAVFFLTKRHHKRISKADIYLELTTLSETRLERLMGRKGEGKGKRHFEESEGVDLTPEISFAERLVVTV